MLKNHMSTCKKTHVNMQHLFLMKTSSSPLAVMLADAGAPAVLALTAAVRFPVEGAAGHPMQKGSSL